MLRKTYFQTSLPSQCDRRGCSRKFSKVTYVPLSKPNLVLVHYCGDEMLYVSKPHGNAKHSARPYKRTCPSVLETIKQEVTHEKPGKVYKKMVLQNIENQDHGILNPRNMKQVSNVKAQVDMKRKLSHDDVYNIIELGYHLSDFVRNVTIFPDLLRMLASKDILQEFEKLLKLK